MAFKLTIDKSIYISDIALMIFQIDLIVWSRSFFRIRGLASNS
jgi:hypothetical protein